MARSTNRKDLDHLSSYTGANPGGMLFPSWQVLSDPSFLRPLSKFIEDNPPVSSRSLFMYEDWWFDVPPVAGSYKVISFRRVAPKLAGELKVAVLCAMAHPALARHSIPRGVWLARNLSNLGSWMTHIGCTSISNLPEGVGDIYLEALAEYADLVKSGNFDPDAGDWSPQSQALGHKKVKELRKSTDMARGAAAALMHLHQAGHIIEPLVGARVRGAPFKESTPHQVAKRWDTLAARTTERLPDAVLNVLIPALERIIDVPALDAIRLMQRFVEEYQRCGHRDEAAQLVMQSFEFSIIPGEDKPWWSIAEFGFWRSWFERLSLVIHMVRDAAILLVLLNVGMRPSELLRLMGGIKKRSLILVDADADETVARSQTVPRCISEVLSKTGFTVLFLLNGHVTKSEERPRPASWLLGGRQDGGADPVALRAMCALEELHRPLRAFAMPGATALLLVDAVYEQSAEVFQTDHLTVDRLTKSIKTSLPLMVSFADIADEEFGRDLRLYKADGQSYVAMYQCRKTYAQRLFGLDERLLGAISRQLQHVNTDTTKEDYVTSDPSFRRELENGRACYTSLLVREALDGAFDAQGTMHDLIDQILAASSRLQATDLRNRLWSARVEVSKAANTDRFRPLAGLANLASKQETSDERRTAGDSDGRGPTMLRSFISDRRVYLAALGSVEPDLGRPARDRAIHAARWLNERGFVVDQTVLPNKGGLDAGR